METTVNQQQNTEVLASDILVAILVNLKKFSGKQQLFLKVYSTDFQNIFQEIIPSLFFIFNHKFTKEYLVYSDRGPFPFCPSLQEAIEQLQVAGMICWPAIQEPDLMRVNPSAEDYYEKVLVITNGGRLPLKDAKGAQQIAEEIKKGWPELIVDHPHFMNYSP